MNINVKIEKESLLRPIYFRNASPGDFLIGFVSFNLYLKTEEGHYNITRRNWLRTLGGERGYPIELEIEVVDQLAENETRNNESDQPVPPPSLREVYKRSLRNLRATYDPGPARPILEPPPPFPERSYSFNYPTDHQEEGEER